MNFDVLIIGGGVAGMSCALVLAGWRSQFAIAAGSGTQVATDILTLWNNGQTTMIHDSEPK